MRTLRVAMAQINTVVGDLDGNAARIIAALEQARSWDADLVAFPEQALPGYPAEDLLLKPQFVRDNLAALQTLLPHTKGLTAIVGFIDAKDDLYNAAAVIRDGALVGVYHKMYLPNYGVFDEDRYFVAGTRPQVFVIDGVGVGVNICEDMWYPMGPTALQAAAGAEVIVNINASPYQSGKQSFREAMLSTRAADHGVIVLYTNLVGGQDELVFDGGSLAFGSDGQLLARGKQFAEDLVLLDLDVESVFRTRLHDPRRRKEQRGSVEDGTAAETKVISQIRPPRSRRPLERRHVEPLGRLEEVYRALVVGTRDYIRKIGFRQVVIGLSGGIDSSLVATIAVDALGKENVVGVGMPSRYSSDGSVVDARSLAENLGIRFMLVPIEGTFTAFLDTLAEPFSGAEPNIAEENLQARIRGMILLSLSNKFDWLVLTTGNKSEMATGYSTLAGDTAGGFAVIKDVPKILVYELCEWRNTQGPEPVIPRAVIDKPPSAELRPNQLDEDSLPPYSILDQILRAYVEEDRTYDEILDLGFPAEVVQKVITLVDRNEYKRRQGPPGVKITGRAFGRDRRLPIVNRYRSF